MSFSTRFPYIVFVGILSGVVATIAIIVNRPIVQVAEAFLWIKVGSVLALAFAMTLASFEIGVFCVIDLHEILNPADTMGRKVLPELVAIVVGVSIWLGMSHFSPHDPLTIWIPIAVSSYLVLAYWLVRGCVWLQKIATKKHKKQRNKSIMKENPHT